MDLRASRARWLLAALAVVACFATACGGDDSGGGGGGGASKQDLAAYQPGEKRVTGVTAKTFPTPKPKGDYVIGVTFPHFKDPYWIAEAYGVQQEADKLGIEVRIQAADGYGDTAGQLEQLDTFITQNVDGMIVGAVDSKSVAPTIDRAWNEGVPVVYANAIADSKRQMGVFTDDELAGTRQADFVAKEDPNAKVIAFCGPPGVIWPKLRCEGFVKRLKEKAPQAEVLAMKYHDMDRAKIADVAASTLQGLPEANWVYNSTDLQAKGVVDALRARRAKPGDVRITNLTIGEELFGLLEDKWITYALAEEAVLQGKFAVDMLVMVLNGEKPAASWAVDLPGYTSSSEDLEKFRQTEKEWNWSPKGYRP